MRSENLMREEDLILRSIARRCVSKDEAAMLENGLTNQFA
jgi:hypothetical protein